MKIQDTSFIVEFLRDTPEAQSKMQELQNDSELYTTVLTMQELLAGPHIHQLPEAKQQTKNLLQTLHVIPYTSADAQQVVNVQQALYSQGTPIGRLDQMIAGICLAHDATLITRDDHFNHVPGLTVETW